MNPLDAPLKDFRDRIRAATANKKPLLIRGGGSKDFYGNVPRGDVLDTRAHAGIVAYEPTEMYIRARAGTPLLDIERALEEHGQMISCEPPDFAGATIGGMLAAGLSGPRRMAGGAVRDLVLGVQTIDGNAEVMNFGGQVMKNVAGFDVSRLMAGSLGTLGLITEVTLKVIPRAAAELTLQLEMTQAQALEQLDNWAQAPLPISATSWFEDRLSVRLSGADDGVAEARDALGGEALDEVDANDLWLSLREQTHPFFGAPLWRLSLPANIQALDLPGEQLIEWNGCQRWLTSEADAREIRQLAMAAGGAATLFRGHAEQKGAHGVFAPLPPQLAELHQRVKKSFDPAGIFNPGRLYPDL